MWEYGCAPFTNSLPWREGGAVVAHSGTEALCQSYRNDLWTKVPAHPKEQVTARGCFLFLPKPVLKGGRDKQAVPSCSLSPVQAMFDCKQHWRPGRLFVHHWTCISFGTDQEINGWCSKRFGAGNFPISLNWNSETSHLGLVLLLGSIYNKLPLFQPDTRLQSNLYCL